MLKYLTYSKWALLEQELKEKLTHQSPWSEWLSIILMLPQSNIQLSLMKLFEYPNVFLYLVMGYKKKLYGDCSYVSNQRLVVFFFNHYSKGTLLIIIH